MAIAPKPRHLSPAHAAQFQDRSVVAAYRCRPPYPAGVFVILQRLMVPPAPAVLDIGCGRGDLACHLLAFAGRVDAVDCSAAMIAAGQRLPGGDDPRLRWICALVEDAPLEPPYALVTAGESLHWMDWARLMPRLDDALAPGAVLAMVSRWSMDVPWWPDLLPLIQRYSTNRDFAPFDLTEELTIRGLFAALGRERTAPIAMRQTIAEYIESIHSWNGFSRERMATGAATEFDAAVTRLVTPFAHGGRLTLPVRGDVIWGRPLAGPGPRPR